MGTDKDILCFCNNVRKLRNMHNLTKSQMSEIMGIGLYSLNLIEKGCLPLRLDIDAVFSLVKYFGIPLKCIFEDIEEEKKKQRES